MKKITVLALLLATSMAFGMSVGELNKASKEDLMKINGIGETKANAIIKHRSKTKFKSISDLEEVKGIGTALAKNIKNDVHKKPTTDKKKTKSKKDTTTTSSTKSKKDTTSTSSKKDKKSTKESKSTKDTKTSSSSK